MAKTTNAHKGMVISSACIIIIALAVLATIMFILITNNDIAQRMAIAIGGLLSKTP